MSAPASRPVHPCILNLTDDSRGAEFSTWAYITNRKPQPPNLVVASASTITVYSFDDRTSKLQIVHTYGNLAGSVIFLTTLKAGTLSNADSLLVAFSGLPRMTVIQVTDSILRAFSLIDLTTVITENSFGSSVALEQDCIVNCLNNSAGTATVACILGGGVAVAVFTVSYMKSCDGWIAEEPFLLPLRRLADSLPHHAGDGISANNPNNQINSSLGTSVITGFGEIFGVSFLFGYLEPALALLHTDPGGIAWCGRLGRITGGAIPAYVSAFSISVSHKRTALLWCREVPSDTFEIKSYENMPGCLVLASNSLIFLAADGTVRQVIAVNGYARSTSPATMLSKVKANPGVKLSIQLHGSKVTQISSNIILVALRMGQLYLLQYSKSLENWFLLSIGQSLGSIGEVANLACVEVDQSSTSLYGRLVGNKMDSNSMATLLFAGSRLGDSLLLGCCLDLVSVPWEVSDISTPIASDKQCVQVATDGELELSSNSSADHVQGDEERTLRLEEEALYTSMPSDSHVPNVVPTSDEEEMDSNANMPATLARKKRQRTSFLNVVRTLVPLDSLVNLGPLGPKCEGPVSKTPDFLIEKETNSSSFEPSNVFGASAHVFPCGFGSSGGIALITAPGRDDRVIVAEEDCLNAEYMFSLPQLGIVFLNLSTKEDGGVRALMQVEGDSRDSYDLSEVDLSAWFSEKSEDSEAHHFRTDIFGGSMLGAGEFCPGHSVLLVKLPDQDSHLYNILVIKRVDSVVRLEKSHILQHFDSHLISVTPFVVTGKSSDQRILFGCLWSSGVTSVVSVSADGEITSSFLETELESKNLRPMPAVDEDNLELMEFYSSETITSIDIFEAPRNVFDMQFHQTVDRDRSQSVEEDQSMQEATSPKEAASHLTNIGCDIYPSETPNGIQDVIHSEFFDEDAQLYQTDVRAKNAGSETSNLHAPTMDFAIRSTFLAVCKKSGLLEVYSLTDSGQIEKLCWYAVDAGIGVETLKSEAPTEELRRLPRFSSICVQEIRFFSCEPHTNQRASLSCPNVCVAIETSTMDIYLYQLQQKTGGNSPEFHRVQLNLVGRPSLEQTRHRSKLIRKGVISKEIDSCAGANFNFRFNYLFRFHAISGQDGLFVAGSRPLWIIAERGKPTSLVHRVRHASPAGCKPRPVSGFCHGVVGSGGFLTLHERVGRVGCQRLTLYRDIATAFSSYGLLPGSGYCAEKIPLGVTVRRIVFVDDVSVSSSDHPLYAVLVSREVEVNQSVWNCDGLTTEERKRLEDDKESAKIQRQVEADLGGFDMESEWVDEIEREECFRVDMDLGGAPPLLSSIYSLWIVDAADKWIVTDSFELGEHEHGIDLKLMTLSEFREESAYSTILTEDSSPRNLFVIVGTGIVNHNGEDVSSKGRVLLFEIKRDNPKPLSSMSQIAELSLTYEKEIFHGPVTSISCLSSEGKNRVVIGAGSDVNIEQWDNGKLTQVGFFRATMQILSISVFKNFFLLSDAYDSLYFLVWRESDKSLTLLAKDYDPISVYASGLICRGAAMTFICHDDRQNFQFFQYAPGEAAARGGNKLVCRADFHYGSQTIAFSSHFCRPSLLVHSATQSSTIAALQQQDTFFGRQEDDNRLGAHFGTTDGGIGSIIPLSEPVYWRMLALQSVMSNALESDCALSRRSWRLYRRTSRRGGCRSNDRKKSAIDGDLVLYFTCLPTVVQEDIASAIGSSVDLILDNLLEIHCSSMIL